MILFYPSIKREDKFFRPLSVGSYYTPHAQLTVPVSEENRKARRGHVPKYGFHYIRLVNLVTVRVSTTNY